MIKTYAAMADKIPRYRQAIIKLLLPAAVRMMEIVCIPCVAKVMVEKPMKPTVNIK